MKEAAGSGRTVLFVSHNLAAVHSLCTRAMVLDAGSISRYGDVDDCIQHFLQWDGHEDQAVVRFDSAHIRELRMTEAALLVNGKPARRAFMGDELALRIQFESDEPLRLPYQGFKLYGSGGECLLNVSNRYQSSTPYASPVTSGTILCELGAVPLVGGRYSISLSLGDIADDIHIADHVISFDVIERDLWGTGQVPPSEESQMWWPTRFSLT
jgi:lipopolysaccharide transport system ATP-binding protein